MIDSQIIRNVHVIARRDVYHSIGYLRLISLFLVQQEGQGKYTHRDQMWNLKEPNARQEFTWVVAANKNELPAIKNVESK